MIFNKKMIPELADIRLSKIVEVTDAIPALLADHLQKSHFSFKRIYEVNADKYKCGQFCEETVDHF